MILLGAIDLTNSASIGLLFMNLLLSKQRLAEAYP